MIPYYLHKKFNFNSSIITYKNESNYPYLEKYCKGLNLEFIRRNRTSMHSIFFSFSIIKYLIKYAKKIDFLSTFHLTNGSVLYTIIYKVLNRNGFTYLKTDALADIKAHNKIKTNNYVNYEYYKRNNIRSKVKNQIRLKIAKKINKIFLKRINLLSIESSEIYNEIKNYNKIEGKIVYIPNGFDDNQVKNLNLHKIPFKQKENIILTVGRLGTYQKATEILLEAITKIKELGNWKIVLIGYVEPKFMKYVANFFEHYPHLKNKIVFTGNISDRRRLFEYYQKSKIFCLPSRWESFGIVLVEAGYFGNYIVSTNIPPAREITLNGEFGSLFKKESVQELTEILQFLICNEKILEESSSKIQKHIEENFLWRNITINLFKEIIKRIRT
ncbi:MAG: glycosyltransferase family 4 protein [Promethearchaeota archaeon]